MECLFYYTGKHAFLYNKKTLRADVQNVLRKAASQPHIRTGSGTSPVGIEEF